VKYFSHLPESVLYQATHNTSNYKLINPKGGKLQVKRLTVSCQCFPFEIFISQYVTLQIGVNSGFIH